jgi:hypothetical protein
MWTYVFMCFLLFTLYLISLLGSYVFWHRMLWLVSNSGREKTSKDALTSYIQTNKNLVKKNEIHVLCPVHYFDKFWGFKRN